MPPTTATRPIRLDSFLRSTAKLIWAHVERFGKVGVTPEFLTWLNCQLQKRGKDTIQLQQCNGCGESYWTLGSPDQDFCCDTCNEG